MGVDIHLGLTCQYKVFLRGDLSASHIFTGWKVCQKPLQTGPLVGLDSSSQVFPNNMLGWLANWKNDNLGIRSEKSVLTDHWIMWGCNVHIIHIIYIYTYKEYTIQQRILIDYIRIYHHHVPFTTQLPATFAPLKKRHTCVVRFGSPCPPPPFASGWHQVANPQWHSSPTLWLYQSSAV